MHRSSSTSRASEEFLISIPAQTKGSHSQSANSCQVDQLPTCDPLSDTAKKESSSSSSSSSLLRLSENAIHLIPFIIILCAIILWFFSHPVDTLNKGESIVTIVEGLTIDASTNQTSSPPAMETELPRKPEKILDIGAEKHTLDHI